MGFANTYTIEPGKIMCVMQREFKGWPTFFVCLYGYNSVVNAASNVLGKVSLNRHAISQNGIVTNTKKLL